MIDENLQELYQEIILDHNSRPRNYRAIEACTHKADGNNPVCGDEVTIFLIVKDNIVKDVSFQGEGCAISKASSSLMTKKVMGKTVNEARKIILDVNKILTGNNDQEIDLDESGDLAALAGVRKFPARIKCATLAWHTLDAALDGNTVISTE